MGIPWETVQLTAFGRDKSLYFDILEEGETQNADSGRAENFSDSKTPSDTKFQCKTEDFWGFFQAFHSRRYKFCETDSSDS